jgi:hypothetical protein
MAKTAIIRIAMFILKNFEVVSCTSKKGNFANSSTFIKIKQESYDME